MFGLNLGTGPGGTAVKVIDGGVTLSVTLAEETVTATAVEDVVLVLGEIEAVSLIAADEYAITTAHDTSNTFTVKPC